jgi:hypothetical protein
MAKLIGTDPNQVPTNGDLGDLAYQNKDSVKIEGGEITADSLNVDGTVTADGLTVEDASSSLLSLMEDESSGADVEYNGATNNFVISTGTGGSGSQTPRLAIKRDLGDISFYEDTGTTPKFFWDASAERLGIGTSSPSALADIYDSASVSSNDLFHVRDYLGGGSDKTRLIVKNGGNVGIGTSSPTQSLEVSKTGAARVAITCTDNSAAGAGIYLRTLNGGSLVSNATLRTDNAGNFSIFTGTTTEPERMRIDSSGNLLVGKSASGVANNGAELQSTGFTSITRDGGQPLQLNRKTSDGDIAVFKKDGTTVGAIGTSSSGDIQFADGNDLVRLKSGKVELRTSGGMGGIFVDDTVNSLWGGVDNTIDLGRSNYRYKDLYLSGGVYLGGTGSANKLDDYEEGTWTPTIQGNGGASGQSYTAQYGKYIKIGNFIYMTYDVEISTVGTLSGVYVVLGSLPFTMVTQNMGGTVLVGYHSSWQNMPSGSGGTITAYTDGNNAYLMTPTASNGTNYITIGDNQVISGSRLIGSFVGYVA